MGEQKLREHDELIEIMAQLNSGERIYNITNK